jgi:hypothetical protein
VSRKKMDKVESERPEITKTQEIMRSKLQRSLVVTSTVVYIFLFGCSLARREQPPAGVMDRKPKESRVPGIIEYYGDKSVLLAPTIVQVNKDFKIKFNTFSGGCEREGDEDLTVSENTATVKVYDLIASFPGATCAMILRMLPHTVSLRFTKPGAATIKIEGIRRAKDTSPTPIFLEHHFTVTMTEVEPDFDPDLPIDKWTVSETGIGPLRIGMNFREVTMASGGGFASPDRVGSDGSCWQAKLLKGPAGISVMHNSGIIARVDVYEGYLATAAGARVGDSEKRIRELYPQVRITPRKDTKGRYLIVDYDNDRQIVFETDGKRVLRYRAGRKPEVEWAEGCP